MIILDTGPIASFVNPVDKDHPRAVALLGDVWTGRYGQALSTDYVLDEGLTLLQARVGRRDVADRFAGMFYGFRGRFGTQLEVRQTGMDVMEEAIELHFKHYDRRLSVTDCTLIAQALRLDAVIGTFDPRFAGLVPLVDA